MAYETPRTLTVEDLDVDTRLRLAELAEASDTPIDRWESELLDTANMDAVCRVATRLLESESAYGPESNLSESARDALLTKLRLSAGWDSIHQQHRMTVEKVRYAKEQAAKRIQASPWAGRPGWETEPALPIIRVTRKGSRGGETEEVPVEPGYELYNRFVDELGFRPFRTMSGSPRVAVPFGDGLEIYEPGDRLGEFGKAVGYQVFTVNGAPVPSRDLSVAVDAIRGRALSRGLPRSRVLRLSLRVASVDTVSRLDMADERCRCIVLGPEGWSIEGVTHPIFDRKGHMLPLPEPAPSQGAAGWKRFLELWRFVSVPAPSGPDDPQLLGAALLVHFLLAPGTPKPVAVFTGDEGAGKSSAAERFQAVIDPSVSKSVGTGSLEDPKELMSLAMNHAVINVDNVSDIPHELSDDLARLSTGMGFAKRELFTDSGEVVGDACPLILLNGITATPHAADLLRRVAFLPVVRPHAILPQKELNEEWEAAHPRILAGLLDLACATARVLRDHPPAPIASSMADYVRVGQAMAVAMGRDPEDFVHAWTVNIDRQGNAAAEDPWVTALSDYFGMMKPDSPAVGPDNVAEWITEHERAVFPRGVTAQAVGNAIARARRTLARMDIHVAKRVARGKSLYYRASAEIERQGGPALDDEDAPWRVRGPESGPPGPPGPPLASSSQESLQDNREGSLSRQLPVVGPPLSGSTPGVDPHSQSGGPELQVHHGSTTGSTTPRLTEEGVRGGPEGPKSTILRDSGTTSTVAGAGNSGLPTPDPVPEEGPDGGSDWDRSARARRAWEAARRHGSDPPGEGP